MNVEMAMDFLRFPSHLTNIFLEVIQINQLLKGGFSLVLKELHKV
jgi:hypothetical protein